ncbi:MAG TPA: PEGA domain-containing protein [Patescibacteria group bacterium]|nr:PEGA domain-containing protein [Patescibacteria group bacterium]
MRKVLIIILIFLSVISITLQLGSGYLKGILGRGLKAGIRVESNVPAKVLLNNQDVGTVPFQDDNLKPGDYVVSLKADEATDSAKVFWEGYAKLNDGSLTIVIRDIADAKEASAGEIISLEPGRGVTITSSPSNAEVFIDGKLSGRTPLSVPDLSEGEHQFIVSRENFLKRSIRSKVIDGLDLIISVDLAITEPDLTKLPQEPTSSTQEIVIKNTPTGFLRVRESASLNAKEIGQVKPKEIYLLLEETPGWVRIRLKDGKEGWVSSSYIQKKPVQAPR